MDLGGAGKAGTKINLDGPEGAGRSIPTKQTRTRKRRSNQMGMFDKPQYLTGKGDGGYVQSGDTFWLFNARMDGSRTVGGTERATCKLQVSRTVDGPREIVYSSGAGIVNQVARMERTDLPMEVRLDTIPSKTPGNNGTHVLTPATEPEPDVAGGNGFDAPADF